MVILSKELQPNGSLCLLSGWLLVAIAQSMLLSVFVLALVRVAADHFSLSAPLELDSPSLC